MTYEELDDMIWQVAHGKPRMELYKKGMQMADRDKFYNKQIYYRLEYMDEAAFYDDSLELYVIFPEVLKLHEEHMKEFGEDENIEDILWRYKHLIENARSFYQISLEQFERFNADFKRRCVEQGFSLRAYYDKSFYFYFYNNRELAQECYEEFLKCKRDDLSDCHACERADEVIYLLNCDRYEDACERAKPVLEGRISCREQPEVMYGAFLRYFNRKMCQGDTTYEKQAAEFCKKLKQGITRKEVATDYIPEILRFYALTAPTKALDYYKKNWLFFEKNRNPETKYYFASAAVRFFDHLKEKDTYKMDMDKTFSLYREDNVYDVAELRAYYEKYALENARKLDTRNGNHYFEGLFGIMTA